MAFLRFNLGEFEWGFQVPDGFIPAIGDTVQLCYGEPDEEGNDAIDCTITKRTWPFWSDFEDELVVDFEVESDEAIPDGNIPDCTGWPSVEYSLREAKRAKQTGSCQ